VISPRTCSTADPGSRDPVYLTCVPPTTYQSLYYHRPQSRMRGKSRWRVSRDDECHAFCESSHRGWDDALGNRWYVDVDGEELGTRRERVAFFPLSSNATGPWHGYPVSALPDAVVRKHVPKEILRAWQAENATKRELLAKLWKRRS